MKSGFQHFMEKGTLAFLALSVIFLVCWLVWGQGVFLTLLITFATFFYHFAVRLAVGAAVDGITAHGVDYDAAWFRQTPAEGRLYRLLKVHQWKLKLPTYVPGSFSLKENTPEQVVCNMCGAEIVHEVNVVVSFVPVVLSVIVPVLRSTVLVFVLTSVAAAIFDMLFVIIQRYNRPRMLKLMRRRQNKYTGKG